MGRFSRWRIWVNFWLVGLSPSPPPPSRENPVLITFAPESFWIFFYIPKVFLKLYLDGKLQVNIISTIKETLVTAKLSVKPFLLTLRTIICFRITINIIWFFHETVIGWPLNLTTCDYSKFMKVICAFNELANFVYVEIRL